VKTPVVPSGGWAAAVAVWVALVSEPVLAQRVQFSSPLAPGGSTGAAATPTSQGPTTFAPPAGSATVSPPPTTYVAPPGPVPGAAPSGAPAYTYPGPAAGPAGPPPFPGAAPAFSAPPSSPYSGPGPIYVPPAPGAMLDGTIQAPAATWDPYGTPSHGSQPLFQQDPYFQSGQGYGPGYAMAAAQRVLQRIEFNYLFMPGNAQRELGINDLELSATFALPLFYNTQTPLLITPGFAIHYWDGPKTFAPFFADLPPRTFDTYLEAAWNPQFSPWLGAELAIRIGIYSDFTRITAESIRFPAKGMIVMALTPSFKLKAGVWYLDRVRVKLLPAGGFIWTPHDDIRFEILFPDPKIAKRLAVWYNTEWWAFLRGEYGGGSWTVKRAPVSLVPGIIDQFDYNDIRVALGLEWTRVNGLSGIVEAGLAFERELRYASGVPRTFFLNSTVFVHAGIAY
jgi:hypothetical protein